MPTIQDSDLPKIKTYKNDFIALNTAQLIAINKIAQRAAHETKHDDQFNGGSIQYAIDEFFEGDSIEGVGVCDPDGVHCVSMAIQLASNHFRLIIMAKARSVITHTQIMIDVDGAMMAELSMPEYSHRRFLNNTQEVNDDIK